MSRITNYNELLLEKKRLQNELAVLNEAIGSQIDQIHDRLKPFIKVAGFVGGFGKKEDSPSLLRMGAEKGLDLLLKPKVLSGAGWIAGIALPFVVKRITSALVNKFKKK